ncbi:hypothetical protein AB0907_36035 [Streptomyces sp. NPDC006975]|uniref:hypothetical protein n=1 Tax=Streptomyces sp. NPDC006975 TaxID=3154310 RepID=UPI003455F0ED
MTQVAAADPTAVPAADPTAVPAAGSTAVPAADPATVSGAEEGAGAPPGKPRRRGRIAAVSACVVLAGALVAGVGTTVVLVRDADRTAGAPVWRFPAKAADKKAAAAPEGLAGVLVPYGTSWGQGPDLGEYGADVQLGGAQATVLRKESLRGLPRSQRQRLEREIDKQRIKGMAMRSYANVEPGETEPEGAATVRVELARMGNQAAVRNIARFQSAFFDALDVFRAGPAVKGHKNAKCFLTPKDAVKGLEAMFCSAYAGDVLVTVIAEGAKPLDTKAVAALLGEQLDRVDGQGEAV